MALKDVYKMEFKEWVDPEFGYTIKEPLVDFPCRTLYFTSNPFLDDNEHLIFAAVVDGVENLYKLNYHTGEYIQITDEEDVHCTISYVDRKNNELYCRTHKKIFSVNLDTYEHKEVFNVKDLEDSSVDLIPSVAITCDGKYLISGYPIKYKMKNNDQEELIDNLYRLFKIDLETKVQSDCRYTNYKVDHIQCSSTDPTYFTYCAWGYWPTHQRAWGCTIDGEKGGPLGNELPREHRTHEYFVGDGSKMAYHGKFFEMNNGVFRKYKDTFGIMDYDGKNDTVYVCPKNYKGAGHSCMSKDMKLIIGDGKLDGLGRISKLYLDDTDMTVKVTPIFTHNTSMTGNFNHPHPSISKDKKLVVFVTDFNLTKTPKFYFIKLKDEDIK